jgi:hypothetical protein
MEWTKVVTDPLGLTGFALALVFGVITKIVSRPKNRSRWMVPAAFAMAAICMLGGLALAYFRGASNSPADDRRAVGTVTGASQPARLQTLKIDKLVQQTQSGVNAAGIQGAVTIQDKPQPKAAK